VQNPPPILFIHYGPALYLRWTLESARRHNPSCRIILLGDESNRHNTKGIAEFHAFEKFSHTELVREFDTSFQVIQGEHHRFTKLGGMETWLHFVFRRWFLIGEFIKLEGIDSFWTFDSDTLILADLMHRSKRFASFDATCQCKGACLNGWVGSAELVHNYNLFTVGLFKNNNYMKAQRQRLKQHSGLAFNEMDAFTDFVRQTGIRTFHAQNSINNEAFDDALAFVDKFEPAREKVLGRTPVKRLWNNKIGRIFAREKGGCFVRLLTCNMSWMPDFLWKRLMSCSRPRGKALTCAPVDDQLVEISFVESISHRLSVRPLTLLEQLKSHVRVLLTKIQS
jgi:hypothetical protein